MNTSFRMGKMILSFRPSTYLYVLQIVLISTGGNVAAADEPKLPVLFKEDFERGMGHWQTTDPDPAKSVWKIIETGADKKNHALRVTGPSTYKPPYRSPFSIALLKDIKVTDFVLTARIKNTAKDAGAHRDLCIIWGYQDPSHFYYVHYGAKPDPGWSAYDMEIAASAWSRLLLSTATEELEKGQRNIRCRLRTLWSLRGRVFFWTVAAIGAVVILLYSDIVPLLWLLPILLVPLHWFLEDERQLLAEGAVDALDEAARKHSLVRV